MWVKVIFAYTKTAGHVLIIIISLIVKVFLNHIILSLETILSTYTHTHACTHARTHARTQAPTHTSILTIQSSKHLGDSEQIKTFSMGQTNKTTDKTDRNIYVFLQVLLCIRTGPWNNAGCVTCGLFVGEAVIYFSSVGRMPLTVAFYQEFPLT